VTKYVDSGVCRCGRWRLVSMSSGDFHGSTGSKSFGVR
jgi:hypothetical protein